MSERKHPKPYCYYVEHEDVRTVRIDVRLAMMGRAHHHNPTLYSACCTHRDDAMGCVNEWAAASGIGHVLSPAEVMAMEAEHLEE